MQTDLTNPGTNDSERGQVSTSAAEIYDRFFLPALFSPAAPRRWRRLRGSRPGTGCSMSPAEPVR